MLIKVLSVRLPRGSLRSISKSCMSNKLNAATPYQLHIKLCGMNTRSHTHLLGGWSIQLVPHSLLPLHTMFLKCLNPFASSCALPAPSAQVVSAVLMMAVFQLMATATAQHEARSPQRQALCSCSVQVLGKGPSMVLPERQVKALFVFCRQRSVVRSR